MKENPDQMTLRSDDSVQRGQLATFLESKLDISAFRYIYSFIYKWIDYHQSFNQKNGLPFYFLKHTYTALAVKLRDLAVKEDALLANQNITWRKEIGKEWTTDKNARAELDNFFLHMRTSSRFKDVDRSIFAWKDPQELTAPRKRSRLNPEAIEDEFLFDEPPPSPKPSHTTRSGHPDFNDDRHVHGTSIFDEDSVMENNLDPRLRGI